MVSIAIPASCISEQACKSLQEATYALYQISRACVIFDIKEIIVYDIPEDKEEPAPPVEAPKKILLSEEDQSPKPRAASASQRSQTLVFSANMLQYLITPAHLRNLLFKPIGNSGQFKYAKSLPKSPGLLDLKNTIQGVAVPRQHKKKAPGQRKLSKKDRKESSQTPFINVGFDRLFKLRNGAMAPTNSRVFVDLAKGEVVHENAEEMKGKGSVGYSVRAVSQFSQIFTQSPVIDGYSQTIYVPSQQFKSSKATNPLVQQVNLSSVNKEKLLIVFGKWAEVQVAVNKDPELGLDDASALFDGISLGTERFRLEDSVMVSLANLQPKSS